MLFIITNVLPIDLWSNSMPWSSASTGPTSNRHISWYCTCKSTWLYYSHRDRYCKEATPLCISAYLWSVASSTLPQFKSTSPSTPSPHLLFSYYCRIAHWPSSWSHGSKWFVIWLFSTFAFSLHTAEWIPKRGELSLRLMDVSVGLGCTSLNSSDIHDRSQTTMDFGDEDYTWICSSHRSVSHRLCL